MGFQINDGGGSATLPSLGNILFVTQTGSTTQSRADGLGRIDKPFELQRAFQVAQFGDIIIIYGATPSATYSVNINGLLIFTYFGSITINFNNTSLHEIYCYPKKGSSDISIQNIFNSKVNVYSIASTINLNNCNNLEVSCEQSCTIVVSSFLSDCTFKSSIRSNFIINSTGASYTYLNIDNFNIISYTPISNEFINCTFNKCIFSPFFDDGSQIGNCFFYDSKISISTKLNVL